MFGEHWKRRLALALASRSVSDYMRRSLALLSKYSLF